MQRVLHERSTSPLPLFLLVVLGFFYAAAAAGGAGGEAPGESMAKVLQSLAFLHTGTTRATDNITLHLQANGNGFSEGYQVWSVNSPRPYAYRTDAAGFLHAPAMGIRSAVPLGGLGTGSFELRGDGTFADWTVENQGTSLASDYIRNSKIPLKNEAFLGLYLEGFDGAVTLRLQPPDDLADSGVPALNYSGAFPFARLAPQLPVSGDAAAPAVYAYAPFKLYDSKASNIPAAVFSLVITNPSPDKPTNVSFLLSLPLGGAKDTDRPLGAGGTGCGMGESCDPRNQTLAVLSNVSATACIAACADNSDCVWWRHSGDGSPAVPEVLYEDRYCGCGSISANELDPLNQNIDIRRTTHGLQACIDYCISLPMCDFASYDFSSIGMWPAPCTMGPNVSSSTGYGCCTPKIFCVDNENMGVYNRSQNNYTTWGKPKPAQAANVCRLYIKAPAVETYYPPAHVATGMRYGPQLARPRSGVKGKWRSIPHGLRHTRNHSFDADPAALMQDPATATADFTLLSADAARLDPTVTVTTASRSTLKELWRDFSDDGRFLEGVEGSSSSSSSHMFGAIAASATLAPGETRTLSLVFAWHTRHRLYVGQDLGNFYATHLEDSVDAATTVAARLDAILSDGAAWNTLATSNSYPRAFADFVSNSLASQVKMAVWVTQDANASVSLPNGRFRQFEAFSNCDLDPVHVSSYHMIPYATFWPDLAANTLQTGWAAVQLPTGMIQETLGAMYSQTDFYRITGRMDLSAEGRVMADTTTVFILYTHATFLSTGDMTFLRAMYPHLANAAAWQMDRARTGINGSFPSYLQNTYDYLGLNEYPAQAYTGFLHLAAMRSMQALAALVEDTAMVNATAASEKRVAQAMQGDLLWTGSFFRAFQTAAYDAPDVAMAGSLHGQSWAHVNNLGPLLPAAMLATHLQAERQHNCLDVYDPTGACVFGLLTLGMLPGQSIWARDASPSMNMDYAANMVWLGLDNASFLLADAHAAASASNALHPALAVIDLYRDTLHDLWNWHDLHAGPFGLTVPAGSIPMGPALNGTGLAGTPFVNAHYARQLQGWAVVRALVGQQWNAHTQRLDLTPPSAVAFFLARVASGGGNRSSLLVVPYFAGGASGQLILRRLPVAAHAQPHPSSTVDGDAFSEFWLAQGHKEAWLAASLTVLAGALQPTTLVTIEVGLLNGHRWGATLPRGLLDATTTKGATSPEVELHLLPSI